MESRGESHRTIKALVFDFVHRCTGRVDYEALTAEVRKRFPSSKWKRTHWAWYRYQILRGRFKGLFSEEERANLTRRGAERPAKAEAPAAARGSLDIAPPARGPQPKDPGVKRIGDAILNHVRFVVGLATEDDTHLRFKLNRWVFSRLLQDEIRVKRPIKKKLWESGMRTCQACGDPFASSKGVELHRKDSDKGYSVENCELLCRECHEEIGR